MLDRTDAGWSLSPTAVSATPLFAVLGVLGGVAFGMIFLNTPPAIVLSFLLPFTWSILGETMSALDTAAQWLDTTRTTTPLTEPGSEMTAKGWAQLGTSQAVWLLLPLVAGSMRIMRKEVR